MIDSVPRFVRPAPSRPANCFEVRSVTGASYTLVEDVERDPATGELLRRYRTGYAGLPVVANRDGTFTIVDTRTRLVRIGTG